jgi:hypothetical protein
MGAAVGCVEFIRFVDWADSHFLHMYSTPHKHTHHSLFVSPRAESIQASEWSQICQRVGDCNRALSSALAGGKLRDIVTLPAGIHAYRPHPAVHLPLQRSKLWKFHNSEGLHLSPQPWLSAIRMQYPGSDLSAFCPFPTIRLPVGKVGGVSCGTYVIGRSRCSVLTCPAVNTHTHTHSHGTGPGGWILSQPQAQHFVSALASGWRVNSLAGAVSQFELLCGATSNPLPFLHHFWQLFPTQALAGCLKTSWAMSIPCFPSPRISQYENKRLPSQDGTLLYPPEIMSFFTKYSLPHKTRCCLTDPHTVFKTCQRCGLILQLELAACHQAYLFYLLVVSSVSPLSPGNTR